jgi:hypothetical protein
MRAELYPDDLNGAPADPLRLAEEYRTYFGQAALDAFIRTHVRDAGWNPAANHHLLLDLPWADILTTNYDTLLERAARSADRVYDPVRTEADIAFAKAPRIVKLHGSIGVSDHFVIAEEDYRNYPVAHAAFVNLARQAFVENELCLIGFSGDDPNFLAWSGWVRDHLGSSARRIFLAGALNLGPAKRKFLEARNIAPIDVYEAVRGLEPEVRHEAAIRLILDALAAMRPVPAHDWTPRSIDRATAPAGDAPALATQLEAMLHHWREDRKGYPGWLICPHGKRLRLRHETDRAPLHERVLEQLEPAQAAEAMYELCWRHRAALWPLHPQTAATIQRFADPEPADYLEDGKRLLVAQMLLRHAGEQGDRPMFDRFKALIEALARPGSDDLAELRHQEAIQACHSLDFARAAALAEEVSGPDPIWALRRAALLAETGQPARAETVVSEAIAELRERERQHRSSLWIRSRLAWASFVHRAYRHDRWEQDPWSDRFRESKCDPFQEVEAIAGAIAAQRRKNEESNRVVPNFDPGSYRLPSQTILFGSTRVEPISELTWLLDEGGAPPRLRHTTLFVNERLEALELAFQPALGWYLTLIRSGLSRSDGKLARYFSRVAIAAMDSDVADGLIERLKLAHQYWASRLRTPDKEERGFAVDRLELVLEILARMAVRADSNGASELYRAGLALWAVPEMQSIAFARPVAHLMRNSFKAVRPQDRAPLVLPSLQIPLTDDPNLPDPIDWLGRSGPENALEDPTLRSEVTRYLEAASPQSPVRGAALSRLTYLHSVQGLTQDEIERFSRAAWASTDSEDPPLPAGSGVFPHYWAALPGSDGRDGSAAVKARVFSVTGEQLDREHFHAMIQAARSLVVQPDPRQAREAFDRVVRYRPAGIDQSDLGAVLKASFTGYNPLVEAHFAGAALTYALAPFLASEDRTVARYRAVERFMVETGSIAAAAALAPFALRWKAARIALTTAIRRGLLDRDREVVSYGCDALAIWLDAYEGKMPVPDQLIEQLVSVIELRRSPALWRLLEVAATLTQMGRLDAERRRRLTVALGDLLQETDYTGVSPLSEEAGEVSLIRQHCVRLATELIAAGDSEQVLFEWRRIAETDPLPEVRYAQAGEAPDED